MAELEVTDATTVAELKCQLGRATQVAPDDQRLWFAGRELTDTATVAACGIDAGTCDASTAHLCGAHPEVMDPGVAKPGLLMLRRRAGSLPFSVHVSYRSLTQLAGYRVAKVEVTSRTTVAELKERLGTAVSLSVANQRLFYGGLELQDGATVGDCGINAAS